MTLFVFAGTGAAVFFRCACSTRMQCNAHACCTARARDGASCRRFPASPRAPASDSLTNGTARPLCRLSHVCSNPQDASFVDTSYLLTNAKLAPLFEVIKVNSRCAPVPAGRGHPGGEGGGWQGARLDAPTRGHALCVRLSGRPTARLTRAVFSGRATPPRRAARAHLPPPRPPRPLLRAALVL